ncbi:hypothetical protein EA472_22300 [Natrarchaeobius oligotrophus]|uniref:Uncharacterized protein n=1 Tax=Natrarchaeobius chitinivorans TaxID=1679083 RepID=A0A3N6MJU4_NATCH|nr:hypothetical protein EA472_22300 [Natrarchaeobius chitinivorans]
MEGALFPVCFKHYLIVKQILKLFDIINSFEIFIIYIFFNTTWLRSFVTSDCFSITGRNWT